MLERPTYENIVSNACNNLLPLILYICISVGVYEGSIHKCLGHIGPLALEIMTDKKKKLKSQVWYIQREVQLNNADLLLGDIV